MRSLVIKFDTDLYLEFEIENNPIASRWLDRFEQRSSWPLDDASRFYGFQDTAIEQQKAKTNLNHCIQIINSYQPIIDRDVSDLETQDTLNYLHNIFERYHGLLDQQHTPWWQSAPQKVRRALADLNIAVHRMESSRNNLPRIVCTWFGMPKEYTLDAKLMHTYGRLATEWGGVYLNYVEIGKTLEDLANDDDQWIGEDAFQPFRHYSADFNVRFYDRMAPVARVYRYWYQHREFFAKRGVYTWDDAAAFPYRFKIAQLRTDHSRDSILDQLKQVNHIAEVSLT